MSATKLPIATLAPVPDAPTAPAGPTLPSAPSHLAQGAAGLAPLAAGSLRVSTLPQRYLLAALIPVAVSALFTLISLFVRWPTLLR